MKHSLLLSKRLRHVVRSTHGSTGTIALFTTLAALVIASCARPPSTPTGPNPPAPGVQAGEPNIPVNCDASNTVRAEVVALEQIYYYNRFGAFNPAGMVYALRRDVVKSSADDDASGANETPIGAYDPAKADQERKELLGNVRLRKDKRPRPLVLRVNEGECLQVTFTNLLKPFVVEGEIAPEPESGIPVQLESDEPATRSASIHVNGLNLVGDIDSDGSNVGRNPSSLAKPGETKVYTWHAKKEGGYLLYSMAAAAGGEGDGGQLGLGLFGSVNVSPKGAVWYRSQLTAEELNLVSEKNLDGSVKRSDHGHPILKMDDPKKGGDGGYDKTVVYPAGHPRAGDPVLAILNSKREIVHSDLNAVIDLPYGELGCDQQGEGNACGRPYREFTTIFHDELTAVQAFRELADEDSPFSALRDGMGINYGAAGLGAMVLAVQKQKGPAAKCAECKLEEFFLSSWANGDPALVLGAKLGPDGKPMRNADGSLAREAKYPDDPSNVHHSYVGDPVRFRNMHAGPKETHVFHLHAHQWVQDKHDPDALYLDSQTISPGSVFSYEIHYGGSGNRNFTPGDSIFHCHLYPHFAQGMWELWRSHDVFEAGTHDRRLPDGEFVAEGTPNPAIVPLPRSPLPPMPTERFRGYPFYVAGQPGHRPPQPPKDLDAVSDPGTLQRHVVLSGTALRSDTEEKPKSADDMTKIPTDPKCASGLPGEDLYDKGARIAACNAGKVRAKNTDPRLVGLAHELALARIKPLPLDGTDAERRAMDFHHGKAGTKGETAVTTPPTAYNWEARGYPTCDAFGRCDSFAQRVLFRVNGRGPKPGAPYADPCPDFFFDGKSVGGVKQKHKVETRDYRAAYIQFDMTVNKAGWHDPQARIAVLEQDVKNTFDGVRAPEPLFFRAKSGECVTFKATNLVPSNLNLDDFQVFSPTDVIGQHIHLVKFDVTSSDGSGNGWNYEDGTLAADEIRERIAANNRYAQECTDGKHPAAECSEARMLTPRTHPMFQSGGSMAGDPRGVCPDTTNPEQWKKHPWCGAQTTIQRWWADPLLNKRLDAVADDKPAQDRTLRTVFTHDHFGPSSHQHHGLYAGLVIEPTNAKWDHLDGTPMGGAGADGKPKKMVEKGVVRRDGGPTSYAANLIVPKSAPACVENPGDTKRCPTQQASQEVDKAREFNLAFADYAIVYTAENTPVNATNRIESDLPTPSLHASIPQPQGISTADPGTQLLNYRNEPIPLRIGETSSSGEFRQKAGPQGDPAHVFSSNVHAYQWADANLLYTEPTVGNGRHSGDPATPLLRAYDGDRVQIRLIQGAQEENHVFSMHGVKWLSQPDSPNSGYVSAQPIGISEHFEFNVHFDSPFANAISTDHLYMSSATDNLWDGQWGLLRAFDGKVPENRTGLARLGEQRVAAKPAQSVCPSKALDPNGFEIAGSFAAPARKFEVTAWHVAGLAADLPKAVADKVLPGGALPYNRGFSIADPNAVIFLEESDYLALKSGKRTSIEPLVLRAAAGECIEVKLKNKLPARMADTPVPHANPGDPSYAAFAAWRKTWSHNQLPPIVENFNFNQVASSPRVGLHPQLVAIATGKDDGAHVGLNCDSTVGPAGTPLEKCGDSTDLYKWYAGDYTRAIKDGKLQERWTPRELGAIALTDMADVVKASSHGAIGALVIEPKDSIYENGTPGCGPDADGRASATICDADGKALFREFVVIYQDDLSLTRFGDPLRNLRNADDAEDTGQKAFNYRTEPLWARLGASPADEPGEMNQRDFSDAFSSKLAHAGCATPPCDPETPIFTAKAGQSVRFRVVHPMGHPRNHAFTVFGHDWINSPWRDNSTKQGWNSKSENRLGTLNAVGPARHFNILTKAGGNNKIAGDYLYRTQEGFNLGGGLWGIFCVWDDAHPDACKSRRPLAQSGQAGTR